MAFCPRDLSGQGHSYFISAQEKDEFDFRPASISGLLLFQAECHSEDMYFKNNGQVHRRGCGRSGPDLTDGGGASVLALLTSLAPNRLCLRVWKVWPGNWGWGRRNAKISLHSNEAKENSRSSCCGIVIT